MSRFGTTGEDLGRRHSSDTAVLGSCAGTKAKWVGFRITLAPLDELASDGMVKTVNIVLV